jgi:hypothetical protein
MELEILFVTVTVQRPLRTASARRIEAVDAAETDRRTSVADFRKFL